MFAIIYSPFRICPRLQILWGKSFPASRSRSVSQITPSLNFFPSPFLSLLNISLTTDFYCRSHFLLPHLQPQRRATKSKNLFHKTKRHNFAAASQVWDKQEKLIFCSGKIRVTVGGGGCCELVATNKLTWHYDLPSFIFAKLPKWDFRQTVVSVRGMMSVRVNCWTRILGPGVVMN